MRTLPAAFLALCTVFAPVQVHAQAPRIMEFVPRGFVQGQGTTGVYPNETPWEFPLSTQAATISMYSGDGSTSGGIVGVGSGNGTFSTSVGPGSINASFDLTARLEANVSGNVRTHFEGEIRFNVPRHTLVRRSGWSNGAFELADAFGSEVWPSWNSSDEALIDPGAYEIRLDANATVSGYVGSPGDWFNEHGNITIVFEPPPLCAGGVSWETGPGFPEMRYAHAVAYDAARSRIVLFGGYGSSSFAPSSTWTWDGLAWSLAAPAGAGPSARAGAPMAYDRARQRIVLFGGVGSGSEPGNYNADTWEWDGAAWSRRQLVAPSPLHRRAFHTTAYDEVRQRVLLFGGRRFLSGQWTEFADFWSWDGTNWTQLPSPGVVGNYDATMAFDAARGVLVLVTPNTSNGHTREWNGSAWTVRSATGPEFGSDYGSANMVYDPRLGGVVLIEGSCCSSDPWAGVWVWNGSQWTRHPIASAPNPQASTLAFDEARAELVAAGGRVYVDTWLSAQPYTWRLRTQQSPAFTAVTPDVSAALGARVVLEAVVDQFDAFAFQWRRNGAPLSVQNGPALTIGSAARSHTGWYELVATGSCGTAVSPRIRLTVGCEADINRDGLVTVQDIYDYLALWQAGSVQADINAEVGTSVQDIYDFLARWAAGC